ncbi:hypothetical protein D3C85_562380 [compost metagenome]
MKFLQKIVLPFSAIFPNEQPKPIKEYLEGIDRETLLKTGSYFLGFSHTGSEYANPYHFMGMFFSRGNAQIFQKSLLNLEHYLADKKLSHFDVEIPYAISSLSFFEIALNMKKNDNTILEKDAEINIFKAYLLLNENITKKYDQSVSSLPQRMSSNKLPAGILIALHLHNFDITNYSIDKLFCSQFIRALMFFEFLSQRDDCKILLEEFYNYFGVIDYKDYLKRILPLSTSIIMRDKESYTDIVLDDSATEKDIEFLDKLIINDINVIEEFDFKNIRANPLYKVSERVYRIVSPLFAMESIYNGLYWKIKTISDVLPKSDKPKDLYGLKTYEFSEKFVLNSILNECFGNRYFSKTGHELEEKYDGAPDYYVRTPKSITIFESKDIMLSAEIKQSVSFDEIEKTLVEKLYKKADGTPKAVMQLINTIIKILSEELVFDSGYNLDELKINPVLVLHYRMFNVGGFNKFLNFWFQEELILLKSKGYDISKVSPLTIIDIDTLIFNKDTFVDQKIELEDCLSEYQENYLNYTVAGKYFANEQEVVQAVKDSYLPFANYLDAKVDQMGWREIPREIKEKGYKIFD